MHLQLKMRILLFLLLAGTGFSGLAQVPAADTTPTIPRIQWLPRQMDVGKVPYGVPVTREYTVRNNSDSLLLIHNVRTGCHCTTATWTTEPIEPGQAGSVRITFDALREEEFYKVIIVFTNQDIEQPMGLIFKGIVGKKPPEKGN